MNRTSFRAAALGCALLSTTALTAFGAAPASAQTAPSAPPPAYPSVDANGVDLVTGRMTASVSAGSIGSGAGAIALEHFWVGSGTFTDNWSNGLFYQTSGGVTTWYAMLGDHSDTFTQSGSTFSNSKQNGATLASVSTVYRYTAADGTIVDYKKGTRLSTTLSGFACLDSTYTNGTCFVPTSVTRPDGTVFTLNWDFLDRCPSGGSPGPGGCSGGGSATAWYRFRGVSSSTGYSFTVNYSTDSPGSSAAPASGWFQKTGVTFSNDVTGCDSSCPSVTYSGTGGNIDGITDALSRQWHFTIASSALTGIRRPGASSDTTTVSYSGGAVSQVVKDGVTTTYGRSLSGTTLTVTVTTPAGAKTITADTSTGRISSVQDELSRTTSYLYDSAGRLTRVTAPEGNYVETSYDARGNATQTQAVPKSGSGLATLTTSATYASSCTSIITCNKPIAITDARGNTTDLQWNTTHGQLDWVRSPAPTSGATRPETRYTYTQTASPVSMGSGTYLLTAVSSCQTGSSCAGTSDEVKSTITYGTNLLPTSTSFGAGDASLTATSAMSYDAAGNLLTVDGPLSGTADMTRIRYNAAREKIGTVSPDPDGAGAMKMRAQKVTLDTHGLVTKVEQGTVNSQSDSDWAAFTSLQAVETGYDANLRPTTQSLTSGGTTYALTQTSYDSAGRPQCVAQRMNAAAFTSLPSDACTLGTQGSYGPDRIVKTTYDAASQVTKVTTAYGVAGVEADQVTKTYTSNGQLQTLTDGENNKTTYVYDGLDRLSQTQYPSSTKGAGTSNSSDYEQLGYDANGNVTSRRLRDANSIAFTYDALNRVTAKDLPGSEPDVSYAYDQLGRMTSAATSSQTYSFTYDALARNLTQVGPNGTLTSAWDIAGRRTRLTHPDGFYVDQDYLVTGELQRIRENGASSGVGVLATYAYDDLGRRTSLTRGNGTTTSYTFDNASRLTQIAEDLSGTTYDQTLGFSYNPASQIASNTRSNDNYAWNGHYNVNRSYTSNGLNQYTASGSVTPTYDSKGNLTSAGSTTYGYSSENLLISTNGGVALAYDPLTRLYQTSGGTPATTRFQYDGTDLVAEYNSSNVMLRRYVHGPGSDEPVVWYEGSGTTDRRFISTDERGSVVATTNSSGTVTAVDSYDEYGIPGSGNTGRFGYTGQTWLPELGLWYYKARIYSPTLGRFLQTDPMGYGAGVNLYAGMGGNPINRTDSTGMVDCGLENAWRSGDCADGAVEHEIRKIGQDTGMTTAQMNFATSQVLDLLHGRISESDLRLHFAAYEFASDLRGVVTYKNADGSNLHEHLSFSMIQSIVSIANTTSISNNVIISIIWKESTFDSYAWNGITGNTAIGLMAVTVRALADVNNKFGYNIDHASLFDPITNVFAGSNYLQILIDRTGSLSAALAKYGTGKNYAKSVLNAADALGAGGDPVRTLQRMIPR